MVCYRTIGSGKSRSMKNFGEDEIFLVNVIGKALPFRGTFRDTCTTVSSGTIIAGLRRMPCRTAAIDDAGLSGLLHRAGHRENHQQDADRETVRQTEG